MQDYPTNDHDRKSLLYWMDRGVCCNIVSNVDPQLSQDISKSSLQFELKLERQELIQGRARRIRRESVEKTTKLARNTRAFWNHAKNAINLLELDPEIAELLGVPEVASRTPSDRADYWIGAVDTILRGRQKAEQLGLPEYVLVPYETLTGQRHELHELNTRYNTLRNEQFLAGEAVKQERERVDHLIRKLSANLRYLLCERSELEQRQIMRRFGYSFRGDTPRANPEPPTQDPDQEETDQANEPPEPKDKEPTEEDNGEPGKEDNGEPTEPADKARGAGTTRLEEARGAGTRLEDNQQHPSVSSRND